jgi:hypothetical protein
VDRRRIIDAAPASAPVPARLTEAVWRIAGGAPEAPISGTSVGPLSAAFNAETLAVGEARWVRGELVVRGARAQPRNPPPEPERAPHLVVRIPLPGPADTSDWATVATPDPTGGLPPVEPISLALTVGAGDALTGDPEATARPEGTQASPAMDAAISNEAAWWAKHGRNWQKHASLPKPLGATSPPSPEPPTLLPHDAEISAPDAASYVAQAEAQQLRGDLATSELSIGKALALDLSVPGGTERRASIQGVLARARKLVSPRERATRLATTERVSAERAAFQSTWDAGHRLEAIRHLRTTVRGCADGRLVERLIAAERGLTMQPRQRVRLDGELVTLVFGEPAWLGRADCAIEVRSPLVSRAHLLFRHDARGLIVVDRDSANGTFRGSARLSGELVVEDTVELALGGKIPLEIQPVGHSARVTVNGQVTVLTLGETFEWAAARLARFSSDDVRGWRLEAPDRESLALGGVGVASIELARGDRVAIGAHVLEIPLG